MGFERGRGVFGWRESERKLGGLGVESGEGGEYIKGGVGK